MPHPNPETIISEIWRVADTDPSCQIYTILDAARNEKVYPAVMDFDGEYCCLFGEGIPSVLAEKAPYLLKLQAQHPYTKWLINEGWGDSWGIFLESRASLEGLKQHFGKFLKVRDEEGAELFFRYYDPRVLRAYIPSCNNAEADMFFGPVHSFFLESADENTLLKYSWRFTEWIGESIALS
jgi:uncharacterized protein DUF4123